MNGHGGARPGAGAPRGGVSQVRRVLATAIVHGLELAGRRDGIEGDAETVAKETAARIVSDMILAGQGADVLKLGAMVAPKSSGGADGDDGDSPVLSALRRMPGLDRGQERSIAREPLEHDPGISIVCEPSATDFASGGGDSAPASAPFFAPQLPLLPVELARPAGAGGAPGAAAAGAPHPPGGAPRAPLYPAAARLENSEKSGGAST